MSRFATSLMRLKAAIGVFRGDMSSDVQEFLTAILPAGRGEPPRRGTADFLAAYSTMPWLRAVVSKVSFGVASVTWHLYAGRPQGRNGRAVRYPLIQRAGPVERRARLKAMRETEELTEIESHPLLDVLNGQQGYLVGLSLRQLSEMYLMLVGEYFWLKERNALGMPTSVWPLPPNWIQATPTPEFPFYQVSFRAWTGNIPSTEILWAALPDPANPYGRGVSVSQALADELETDEYAAKHMKAFFYNRARPDLIISAPGLQQQETRRLEEDWLNKHRGFWTAFKPYFLNREVQIKEITQSFEDLQMVPLRQHERDTVLQVLAGLPPEMLGILTSSNRATIDAADTLFAKWIVVPRCEFQREILQARLVPEYDERLILDYDDPVPEDREFELRAAQAAPWALTMDEWRALQGQPPKENGQGEIHAVPLGIQFRRPEDLEYEEPPLTTGPTGRPQAATLTRPRVRRAITQASAALQRLHDRHTQDLSQRLKSLRQKLNWVDTPSDDPFYLAVHRLADRLTPAVRQRFLDAVATARGSFNEPDFIAAVTAGNVEAALQAIPMQGFEETFAQVQQELHTGVVASGEQAAQQLTALGFEMTFNHMDPGASAWARNHAAELVRQVSAETQASIRALVVNALDTGVPPRDLARQIRPLIGLTERQAQAVEHFRTRLEDNPDVTDAAVDRRTERYADAQLRRRSETIARTETLASTNQGQLTAWNQAVGEGLLNPQETTRVWITTPDDRLCEDECEPMDGTEAPLNEAFENGLMAPPLHPNCRCTIGLEFHPAEMAAPEPMEPEDLTPEPPAPPAPEPALVDAFDPLDDPESWAEDHYEAWPGTLSEREEAALLEYQDEMHEAINDYLRFPDQADPDILHEVTNLVQHIDTAIAKAPPTDLDLVVYRGFELADVYRQPEGSLVGQTWSDRAFVSTSTQESIATGFNRKDGQPIVLHIELPKGTRAAWMNALDDIGEAELVLPRDKPFRITADEFRATAQSPIRHVTMRALE